MIRTDWSAFLSTAIRERVDALVGDEDHESLRLLRIYRPPRPWIRRWILSGSPTDTLPGFLAAVVLDRWHLIPNIRALAVGDRDPLDHCDLCQGGIHAIGQDHGSLESVLLQCPALDDPCLLWFELGREVAATPLLPAPWWDSTAQQGPPRTATLVATLFGHGAVGQPELGLTQEELWDLLTGFFLYAFRHWLKEHANQIHYVTRGSLPTPELMTSML